VGRLRLTFCAACGTIQNSAFDREAIDYTESYEDDQAFSPRFRAFAASLAQRVVDTYQLRDKDVLEIGCGGGYFLALLCELGENRGIGIDPACEPGRRGNQERAGVRFIEDFYSLGYRDLPSDLICCRHTLEHLPEARKFVQTIRESLGDRRDPVVFFEVPDVARVLEELAFWDFYYEHCSYFSLGSLARLFRSCDFEVLHLAKEFDGQYLVIEARAGEEKRGNRFSGEDDLEQLKSSVRRFAEKVPEMVASWRKRLGELRKDRRRAVLWGAGSKAVGFLSTLGAGVGEEIEYVVDINPRKEGTYLAGTGQRIVAPDFLREYAASLVIVMNPIYLEEIRGQLQEMGLNPDVMAL